MKNILLVVLFSICLVIIVLSSQLYVLTVVQQQFDSEIKSVKGNFSMQLNEKNNYILNLTLRIDELEHSSVEHSYEIVSTQMSTDEIGQKLNSNTQILYSMIQNQTNEIKDIQQSTKNELSLLNFYQTRNLEQLDEKIRDNSEQLYSTKRSVSTLQYEGFKSFDSTVYDSIFILENYENTSSLLGTAFAVSDSIIITNAHNIVYKYVNLSYQNKTQLENVSLIYKNDSLDIAILNTSSKLKYLKFVSQNVSSGSPSYVIGHSFGYEFSLTSGVISSLREFNKTNVLTTFVQHDTPAGKGNSGGPLLDSNGRVIGMHSGGFVDKVYGYGKEGISFALYFEEIKQILKSKNITI